MSLVIENNRTRFILHSAATQYPKRLSAEERIVEFRDDHPEKVLGIHRKEDGKTVVRAFLPHASTAQVRTNYTTTLMRREGRLPIFEAEIPEDAQGPLKFQYSTSTEVLHEAARVRKKRVYRENLRSSNTELAERITKLLPELSEQEAKIIRDKLADKDSPWSPWKRDMVSMLLELEEYIILKKRQVQSIYDPYSIKPDITDEDAWYWNQGTHDIAYERFGARLRTINGVKGVNFALWAPHAQSICVTGDFNEWTAGAHPMSRIKDSGIWGLFIPELQEGAHYKFVIKHNNHENWKIDPFALAFELRPENAPVDNVAVVTDIDKYKWQDDKWMKDREKYDPYSSPMSIYEVHLGSFIKNTSFPGSEFLNYRQLAHMIVNHAKDFGYTHIELMPITEHPLYESWGYQCTGYFAPTCRYGKPEDLMYLVDHCHQNGIGVIIDWTPNHFCQNEDALSRFDGTPLIEYADRREGWHEEWGTYVPDYRKPQVRNFLTASALFWLNKYHFDGVRVDGVASMLYKDYARTSNENREKDKWNTWIPNCNGGVENIEARDFLRELNKKIHENHKGVLTIAEESTPRDDVTRPYWWGGLGFSMKWNMGWMNDTLRFFEKDPLFRKELLGMLLHTFEYADQEHFVLPLSHDEVTNHKGSLLSKMPGDDWQKFANLRLLLSYMTAFPGKMISFMTNDIAQNEEWDPRNQLSRNNTRRAHSEALVRDLNKLYREKEALHELDRDKKGCYLTTIYEDEAVFSFVRLAKDRDKHIVVVCNMTPKERLDYLIEVPYSGYHEGGSYREIFSSDAPCYGGTGQFGNLGDLRAGIISVYRWEHYYNERGKGKRTYHEVPYGTLYLNIPPLSVTMYEFVPKAN